MKSPEVPKENVREKAPDVVLERADLVDVTRKELENLSRRLSLPEGWAQERFVA